MSIAASPKTNAVNPEWLKRAAQTLGVKNDKRLGAAVTQAAVEWLGRDEAFAAHVRALYAALPAPAPARGGRGRGGGAKALEVELRPIKHVEGFVLNPALPPNPYLIFEAYGADQLPIALDLFPLASLKAAAAAVTARNPGTKPASKGAKASVIEYIVRYVTRAG